MAIECVSVRNTIKHLHQQLSFASPATHNHVHGVTMTDWVIWGRKCLWRIQIKTFSSSCSHTTLIISLHVVLNSPRNYFGRILYYKLLPVTTHLGQKGVFSLFTSIRIPGTYEQVREWIFLLHRSKIFHSPLTVLHILGTCKVVLIYPQLSWSYTLPLLANRWHAILFPGVACKLDKSGLPFV